jgi:MFS family permease
VSRIFASLAFFSLIMLSIAMIMGFYLDLNAPVVRLRELSDRRDELKMASTVAENHTAELERVRTMLEESRSNFSDERKRGARHMLVGIAAALIVVLVCSISITYFIGTNRWCREVVETYGLNADLLRESQNLKRRAFSWAVLGISIAMVITALGAAADPGTGIAHTAEWVTPHLVAALAGICLIGYCFYSLWGAIIKHHFVIQRIMGQVHDLRLVRELETSSETHAPLSR